MLEVFGEFLLYILIELVWQGVAYWTGYALVRLFTFGQVTPDELTASCLGALVLFAAFIGLGVWLWR